MSTTTPTSDNHRLDGFDLDDQVDAYDRLGIAGWSDAELVAAAGVVLADPKDAAGRLVRAARSSRAAGPAALLTRVRPEGRERARRRIVELVAGYQAAGEVVSRPGTGIVRVGGGRRSRLTAALVAGDLEEIDRSRDVRR